MFSIVLPNTELFMSLIKSFSKSFLALALRLVFLSMYSFNQGLSSNLIRTVNLGDFHAKALVQLEIFVM